jgi:hypothetical protein
MRERPYTVYPWYAPVAIPVEVAVCPACKTAMTVGTNAVEQNDDGTWQASEIEWTCASDPESVEADDYADWLRTHDQLTYQEMVETDARLLAWLTAHVRFVEDTPHA